MAQPDLAPVAPASGSEMQTRNVVSWAITYLGDLQPTYIGVIIQLLSTMDIPVDFYYRIIPPNNKLGFALHSSHLCQQMIAIKSYICHMSYVIKLNCSVTFRGIPLAALSKLPFPGGHIVSCNVILSYVTLPPCDLYNYANIHTQHYTQIYVYHFEFDGRFGDQDKVLR